ncbi:DUF3068 domain-containing protein [Segniliparus rugosus]|uniref:DUF3068 domain-containing protein n=1 Tax=Segniliparus rugosus (strain ATCC BAA-974 / DSM 45345 / CCUG 50838 / CIP 108380 / JCM 13579 / CDC 945) TaxID=679197 RepID=E5XVE8_SEGRC|nr:DUF3068 domain-containing protein [Segniliparus rugosus]EFV11688.1 hypothetical protein HMPREF9336_03470 [Segniliparus rugosus ATCC BAA-974]
MTQQTQPGKAPILLPLALIALGAALIAIAVLVPFYSEDELVKASLGERITLVSPAQSAGQDAPGIDQEFPAQVIDRCSVGDGSPKAAVLSAKATIRTYVTVEEPSTENTVTYQAGTSVLVSEVKARGDGQPKTLTPVALQRPAPGAPEPKLPWSDGQCDNGLLLATVDRVTVGRHNGLPVAKGLSEVQVEPEQQARLLPNRSGQQYRFPFDTSSKGQYQYFDLTTGSAFPATYVENTEISDIKTLHFRVDIPETDLALVNAPAGVDEGKLTLPPGTALTKPLDWWNIPNVSGKQDQTMHRFYKNGVDLYVDPDSGVIVRERQDMHQYFAMPFSAREAASPDLKAFTLTIFSGVFDYDPQTVEATVKQAKSYRDDIALLGRTIPIGSAVLGLVLLAGGGVIYYRLTR